MLTRQQLQRIAQRRAIGLHALERDYVQYLVLSILYTRGQSFVFKGGTALRVVHHSPRYFEDLDFNTTVDLDATKQELSAGDVASKRAVMGARGSPSPGL